MTERWRGFKGVLIGAAIAPFALGLAVLSGGAGHGGYFLAKLLFPYSMLLTPFANDTITSPIIGLALLQFPLYGLAATTLASRRHRALVIGTLLLLHSVATVLCFVGFLPNFS